MVAAAIFFKIIAFVVEGGADWWNYPGLELWRFVNLLLFVLAGIYLHRRFGKPISEGLKARREQIKLELERARQEREQAHQKLAEIETRLEALDTEVAAIRAQAAAESLAERERIRQATEVEMKKLREQAQREIGGAAKAAQLELRRFAASQSIRLAEDLIRRDINADDDARLIQRNVAQLGGSGN